MPPTYPAINSEKRKFKRVPVSIPATLHLKDAPKAAAIPAEITDISEGGAFVHCTAPIAIGKEVLVEIVFEETTILQGKVVQYDNLRKLLPRPAAERSVIRWVRGSSVSGFGMEFIDLQPDKKAFLKRLVTYFEQLEKAGVTFLKP